MFADKNLAKPILNTSAALISRQNVTSCLFFSGHGRWKRTHWIKKWNGCSPSDEPKMNECLNTHGPDFTKIKLTCKYKTHTCFYMAECKHYDPEAFSPEFKCEKIVHKMNWPATCCSPSCWFSEEILTIFFVVSLIRLLLEWPLYNIRHNIIKPII